MASPLTAGFCQRAHSASETPEGIEPVLQVLSVKRINSPAGGAQTTDRYRVILSDGEYFIQSMLATQLNHMVENDQLEKNTVIKLTSFVINTVQNRKLIIILGLELQNWTGAKVGNPVNVDQRAPGAGTASPAPEAAAVTNGAASRGTASNARPAPAANRGPSRDMGPIFPIEGLSPYQNKWTIKARVTQKSDIKHWSNQRGEGKLFSVTLMDETGEIRATGFNDQVDAFYNVLEEGKVFFISKARINIAKKQFSNVNNEYEITFENQTEIEPCGDDKSVPEVKYNFTKLDNLESLQKDATTDVIGVVQEIHELGQITSKATQKPFNKRDIQLVDQSGQSVRLTLWGKTAENFNYNDHPVVAFKGVKVSDFGGRSLSMFSSATMTVNPNNEEAFALRGWYDSVGQNANFKQYTNSGAMSTVSRPDEIKTIGQAKDEQLGMSDKTDYFSTSATILYIKQETFSYPACPNPEGCNKKVTDEGDGWRCEKCDRSWPAPVYRYILQMNVIDYTGSFWITGFNEVAEQIMGISANDLQKLKADSDPEAEKLFTRATGREWDFKIMAKQDFFNDQARVRYQARGCAPINYAASSADLIAKIEAMSV